MRTTKITNLFSPVQEKEAGSRQHWQHYLILAHHIGYNSMRNRQSLLLMNLCSMSFWSWMLMGKLIPRGIWNVGPWPRVGRWDCLRSLGPWKNLLFIIIIMLITYKIYYLQQWGLLTALKVHINGGKKDTSSLFQNQRDNMAGRGIFPWPLKIWTCLVVVQYHVH